MLFCVPQSDLDKDNFFGSVSSAASKFWSNFYVRFVKTEFFQISCLAVAESFAVISLVQHIKVFFIKKGYTFFFHLTFFYELVSIFIVIVYVTVKTLIFYVEFTKKKKKNKFFSLFSFINFSYFEN